MLGDLLGDTEDIFDFTSIGNDDPTVQPVSGAGGKQNLVKSRVKIISKGVYCTFGVNNPIINFSMDHNRDLFFTLECMQTNRKIFSTIFSLLKQRNKMYIVVGFYAYLFIIISSKKLGVKYILAKTTHKISFIKQRIVKDK